MNDPKDLMEQIARLDDELDIQPKHPQPDPVFTALVEYDKLQIVFSQLMEYWLEGMQPPESLVNEYYDQLTQVQVVASDSKLFEKISRETADFFDKINSQYALDNTRRL